MRKAGSGGYVRLIQTLWDEGSVGSLQDAELLDRFLARDGGAESAFAALVRRHAPMVVRVCRDVTGNLHDAQDAAQATFLILAQKARFIRRRETLANWLFGTARRVAARALRASIRRRRHERLYAETAATVRSAETVREHDQLEWAGLYEEVDRLPERYRAPIVLCDLEGLTHDQAAVALGCPHRTLETRLYRGRERLRQGLIRRGLMPAIGLVGGTPSAGVDSITISTAWADSTVLAATRLVTGKAVVEVAPAAVTLLIYGMNRAMFLTKLKWIATSAGIMGLCAALTLGLTGHTPGAGMKTKARATGGGRASARLVPSQPKKPAKVDGETKPPAAAVVPPPTTAPITVTGRATDAAGKPVAGATVFLVSTNGTDAPLGATNTDGDGKFAFRKARLPVSPWRSDTPVQGAFQVYGTAPSHGFAWHGMRHYLPQPRPADRNVSGEDYNIFLGEPMVMDLRFPPAATLSGRIVDEVGRPVPDARIRLDECDYLDTEHKESHHNYREFWAIQNAPAAMRTTKTGQDGRFRLDGLPKEAGFWVHVTHPDHAGLSLFAATTTRPTSAFDYPIQSIIGRARPPVLTGEINVTLHSTRRIPVRTIFSDSGRPAPRVRVAPSQGSSATGYGANGQTDAEGKLLFRLPPGDYDILADPTAGSADCVRTLSTFRVTDQPLEQSLEVRVDRGCVLFLEAVDAETGKGIPGVTFLSESDNHPGSRVRVQGRTGYIDNPETDANGRIRAVVVPGERVYSLGRIPESAGYKAVPPAKRVTVPAGQTVTVRFELHK